MPRSPRVAVELPEDQRCPGVNVAIAPQHPYLSPCQDAPAMGAVYCPKHQRDAFRQEGLRKMLEAIPDWEQYFPTPRLEILRNYRGQIAGLKRLDADVEAPKKEKRTAPATEKRTASPAPALPPVGLPDLGKRAPMEAALKPMEPTALKPMEPTPQEPKKRRGFVVNDELAKLLR